LLSILFAYLAFPCFNLVNNEKTGGIFMPWDMNDYPASMKNMEPLVRKKAIDIANALEKEGYDEDRLIPIAQSQAGDWYDNASEEEKKEFEDAPDPSKKDEHDASRNPDLIDNDVEVVYEDAVARAEDVARNKESAVHIYKQDGSLQEKKKPKPRED
jgi:uncharacterized protein YdaT